MLQGSTYRGSHYVIPGRPVAVGHQRQLLLDDYIVEDQWNCRRMVHQPIKHPDNPVVSPTRPSEAKGVSYLSVFHDQDTDCVRLWGAASEGGKEELSRRGVYYESEDGIDWRYPELDLVEFEGHRANNIFLGGDGYIYDNLDVIPMPSKRRERGNYALLYNRSPVGGADYEREPAGGMQVRLAFSDDGWRWQDQEENPVLVGRSDTHNNLIRTRAGGSVRVAIRRGDGENDGEWLPEWNFERGMPGSGDAVDQVVGWQGQESMDALKGRAIRLHFWLHQAELFSFSFA